MSPRLALGLASLAFCAWLCAVPCVGRAAAEAASARGLALEWTAPEGCGHRAELLARVRARVGGPVALDDAAALEVSGEIEDDGGVYTLELATQLHGASAERELRSARCAELVDAAALMIALLLRAPAPRVPDPDSAEAEAEPGLHPWLGAALAGDLGPLPGLAFGPSARAGVRLGATSFDLGLVYLPPSAIESATSIRLAELQLLAASLAVCRGVTQRPSLAPCVRFEYGRIWGRGRNVPAPLSGSAPWAVLGLGARLGVPLGPALSAQAELSGGITLDRSEFAIAGFGRVHRIPAVVGRLQMGAAFRF